MRTLGDIAGRGRSMVVCRASIRAKSVIRTSHLDLIALARDLLNEVLHGKQFFVENDVHSLHE